MPESVRRALAEAAARLAATSDTPRLDAEVLMAHALGLERLAMLLDADRLAVPAQFADLVERRAAHVPVAYLIGRRDFHGISVCVGPGALIPRPDSECLIEAAAAHFAGSPGPARVLDLGCGPGTLLVAALALWPDARGLGLEASAAALAYAPATAEANGVAARALWRHGRWGGPGWADALEGPFDLVLANPPYIPTGTVLMPDVAGHEPAGALFAGADGLDDYRIILPALPMLLAPGGVAVVEMGWNQADAVGALADAVGLSARLLSDLGGRARGFAVTHGGMAGAK